MSLLLTRGAVFWAGLALEERFIEVFIRFALNTIAFIIVKFRCAITRRPAPLEHVHVNIVPRLTPFALICSESHIPLAIHAQLHAALLACLFLLARIPTYGAVVTVFLSGVKVLTGGFAAVVA